MSYFQRALVPFLVVPFFLLLNYSVLPQMMSRLPQASPELIFRVKVALVINWLTLLISVVFGVYYLHKNALDEQPGQAILLLLYGFGMAGAVIYLLNVPDEALGGLYLSLIFGVILVK